MLLDPFPCHKLSHLLAEASIPPEAMMHFPPFQISPCFPKNFLTAWKISPFTRKFFRFSGAKISDDLFLVINHKFRISSPNVAISIHFSPYFDKHFLSLLLLQISPCFWQIYVFFTYFMCFSFPPTFTMMHLCITQCTYWTPLQVESIALCFRAKTIKFVFLEYC